MTRQNLSSARPPARRTALATLALAVTVALAAQLAGPVFAQDADTPDNADADSAGPLDDEATVAEPVVEEPSPPPVDLAAGEAKAAVCAGCHGLDGKALQPAYPNIGGQHPAYIAKQLTNYREGERVNAIMNGIAATLTDADIQNLSAFYGSKPHIEGVVADEETLEHGESIYRGGITSAGVAACSGCHSPQGLGNPAAAWPVLSGQNVQYTIDQLKLWRSAERANDPNAMMRNIAKRLTDDEIEAVSSYIQGLY